MEQVVAKAIQDNGASSTGVILGIFIALWALDKGLDIFKKRKSGGQQDLSDRVLHAVAQVDDMHQYYRWKGEKSVDALEKMTAENTATNLEICRTLKKIQEGIEAMKKDLVEAKCRAP